MRRGSLHAYFADPGQCLLAAYQQLVSTALSEALELALDTAEYSKPGIAHSTVDELVCTLIRDSHFARLAFYEVLTVGAAAVSVQTRLLSDFAAMISTELPMPRQPQVALSAGTGALWATAGHLVVSGQAGMLATNSSTLRRLMLPRPADDLPPHRQ